MKLGTTLTSLGLHELPQDASMNGFDKTIVFIFSQNIAEKIGRTLNTLQIPELAILRKGRIENNGEIYSRKNVHIAIPYSFLYFNNDTNGFSCVTKKTGEKVIGILGRVHKFDLSQGVGFTAAKYFDAWKKLQENPNYINPYNL